MSEHSDTSPARHPLGTALAELAGTVPDDPDRLDAVHARIRRLRTRRRVRRSAVAGVAALAAVSALAVLVPRGQSEITSVAGAPSTVPAAMPSCRAALANPTRGAQGVKGFGTVVAATPASVTIHVDEPPQPAGDLTAAITGDTLWLDAGVEASPLALAAGDRVVFGAEETDGGYRLAALEVHPTASLPASTDEAKAEAKAGDAAAAAKAAGAMTAAGTDDPVKAPGTIVAIGPAALTVRVSGGPLAGQDIVAATDTATIYRAGGTQCTGADLAAGDVVAILARTNPDGSYTTEEVNLLP